METLEVVEGQVRDHGGVSSGINPVGVIWKQSLTVPTNQSKNIGTEDEACVGVHRTMLRYRSSSSLPCTILFMESKIKGVESEKFWNFVWRHVNETISWSHDSLFFTLFSHFCVSSFQ